MAGPNTTGLPRTSDYNLGRGKIYFGSLTDDLPTVYRFLGNAPAFTVNIAVEELEHFSSTGGLKTLDKKFQISRDTGVSLQLDEVNHQNLALFFSGDSLEGASGYVNPADGALGSTVDIVSTAATVGGRWYNITDAADGAGNRLYTLVRAGLVVSYGGTPTGLAQNQDISALANNEYYTDEIMGRIFLPESSLADGDTLEYTYTDQGGEDPYIDEVRAGTQGRIEGALKFVAENPADNDKLVEYQFHKVSLLAEGDYSLIGDEVTTVSLTGSAEKVESKFPDSPIVTIRYVTQ